MPALGPWNGGISPSYRTWQGTVAAGRRGVLRPVIQTGASAVGVSAAAAVAGAAAAGPKK